MNKITKYTTYGIGTLFAYEIIKDLYIVTSSYIKYLYLKRKK